MDLLNPPTNYIGTSLFLSYILTALFFTSRITLQLYRSHLTTPPSSSTRPGHLTLLTTLATITFSSLSYHMLSFLIQSYTSFCHSHNLAVLPTTASATAHQLWTWMLSSTLFTDFARALVTGTPSSAGAREVEEIAGHRLKAAARAWSQTALVWSLGASLFIGVEGRRSQGKKQSVGRGILGDLVVLAQVLPVSFALMLFLLDAEFEERFLSSPSCSTTTSPRRSKRNQGTSKTKDGGGRRSSLEEAERREPQAGWAVPIAVGAYLAVLTFLPDAEEFSTTALVAAVFFLRMCLFVPFLATRAPATRVEEYTRALDLQLSSGPARRVSYVLFLSGSGAVLVVACADTVRACDGWRDLLGGVWANSAVGALGMDAVLGMVGVCSALWIRGTG